MLLLASCQKVNADYDILIVGGTVYDGTGGSARLVNLGIVGERIVSMDADGGADAIVVIDASDLVVTPGFIDPHTHARSTLLEPDIRANLNYLTQGVTTVFIGNDGYGLARFSERLEQFDASGVGTNVAVLSGHGRLRTVAVGLSDRAATAEELDAMREALRKEMALGSFGLSSGLFYRPGSYADTGEVIELARVAAEFGGVYDTHMRSESSAGDGLLTALDEAIEIGREAGIPVHIAHIKALGQDRWGSSDEMISRIEAAREDGIEVTADQYPWKASGTRFSNALLPRWVQADSADAMAQRLADSELRPGILNEMRANLVVRGGPDAMLVTAADSEYRGMTLAEISETVGEEPVVAAIGVVLGGDPSIASFVMDQGDIEQLAVQPWVMTGSDGSSGHPRLYGTYPKAWQDLVGGGLMTPAAFVRRSSGLVAESFRMCERGLLAEGYFADIAIIDAQGFRPRANYENPTELSEGVAYLLVNGAIVIDNNNYNGSLAGRALRRTDCND